MGRQTSSYSGFESTSSDQFDAEVVTVGSGVMGSLIATGLAKASKSVIVLEAGPRVNRRDIVETFRNAPVKLSLANAKLQGAGPPYPRLHHAPSTYGDYLQQVPDRRPSVWATALR